MRRGLSGGFTLSYMLLRNLIPDKYHKVGIPSNVWPTLLLLLLLLLLFVITFMHCVYSYIPETNHVSNACNIAAVL